MPAMIAISAKPESDSETTFDLPKGVDFTDVKEGDEKEVTAVLRKEADGKVCIVKVNGVPLNKDDEEEESSDEQEAEGPADSEAMAPPSPTMGSAAQSVGLM